MSVHAVPVTPPFLLMDPLQIMAFSKHALPSLSDSSTLYYTVGKAMECALALEADWDSVVNVRA